MLLVENIKKACSMNNITIRELERRAGLPEHSIYKWNRNIPSVDRVARVADILKTTVEQLIK